MAKKKVKVKKSDASFEDSLSELETIVSQLEAGELGLGESLEQYEQGVSHLKTCQQLLEKAERKIELLSGVDADGNPVTRPFDESETETLDQKATARSKRRSAKGSTGGTSGVDDGQSLF